MNETTIREEVKELRNLLENNKKPSNHIVFYENFIPYFTKEEINKLVLLSSGNNNFNIHLFTIAHLITKETALEYLKNEDSFGKTSFFDELSISKNLPHLDFFIQAFIDNLPSIYKEEVEENKEPFDDRNEIARMCSEIAEEFIQKSLNENSLGAQHLDEDKLKEVQKALPANYIYSLLSTELQEKYFDVLIAKNNEYSHDEMDKIWGATKSQTLDKYNKIRSIYKEKNYDSKTLLQDTRTENKELCKYVFENEFNTKNDKFFELFYNSKKANPGYDIDTRLINPKFDFLNFEQFSRLNVAEDDMLEIISDLTKTDYGFEMVKYLFENAYEPFSAVGKLIRNMDDFKDLFLDPEFNKRTYDPIEKDQMLAKISNIIIGNDENVFATFSVEDLENYDELRNYEVNRIFKNLDNFKSSRYEIESGFAKEKKAEEGKFAIIEALYGISLNDAKSLVKIYGKHIEDLNPEEGSIESNIKDFVISLKNILNLNYSDTLFLSRDKEFLQNIYEPGFYNIASISDVESHLRDMYTKEFQNSMLKIDENVEPDLTVPYGGKEIKVYEIPRKNETGEYEEIDFGLFARVEGAYAYEYRKPVDYAEHFSQKDVTYHGNCESFINQSMTSVARQKEKNVLFFYDDCETIHLCAPWDLNTYESNFALDPANVGGYYDSCFMIPDRFIDNTRHLHNEFVSEKYKFDNEKIEMRKPKVVGNFKDELDSKVSLKDHIEQYEEGLKAAYDLDLPILVINREALAIQEQNRIQRELESLRNYDKNTQESSYEKILSNIINRIENNRVGSKFVEAKSKMFSNENRENVINEIVEIIDKVEEPERSNRYRTFIDVLLEEDEKPESDSRFYSVTAGGIHEKITEKEKYKPQEINPITQVKQDTMHMREIYREQKEKELIELQEKLNKLNENEQSKNQIKSTQDNIERD